MFARGGDGFVGFRLGGERDEGDVGDLVNGLAAYLCDLFATAYRYQEDGSSYFEESFFLSDIVHHPQHSQGHTNNTMRLERR